MSPQALVDLDANDAKTRSALPQQDLGIRRNVADHYRHNAIVAGVIGSAASSVTPMRSAARRRERTHFACH